MSNLSVSEAARRLSEEHGVTVAPPVISTLFYKRLLDDKVCPVCSGRRLIPEHYLSEIEVVLRKQGILPKRNVLAK